MSRLYTVWTTLVLSGREDDYRVRCHVDVVPSRSRGVDAELDGDPEVEVSVPDGWVDADLLDLDATSRKRIVDVLREAALEDDSDQCALEEIALRREELAS
jgi:hypothetical protein